MFNKLRVVLISIALTVGAVRGAAQNTAPPVPMMSRASFDSVFARVNNAGRWGAQDQVGTLNLITPAKRGAAAALCAGRRYSFAGAHRTSRRDAKRDQPTAGEEHRQP
jgi:hypothetical protein